jgi:hypothetical protein
MLLIFKFIQSTRYHSYSCANKSNELLLHPKDTRLNHNAKKPQPVLPWPQTHTKSTRNRRVIMPHGLGPDSQPTALARPSPKWFTEPLPQVRSSTHIHKTSKRRGIAPSRMRGHDPQSPWKRPLTQTNLLLCGR